MHKLTKWEMQMLAFILTCYTDVLSVWCFSKCRNNVCRSVGVE